MVRDRGSTPIFFFPFHYPVVPISFVEKTILLSLNSCDSLIKNQLTVIDRVYFWTLNSTASIYISLLMIVLRCIVCSIFVTNTEIGECESPTLFFFSFSRFFCLYGSLNFHMAFRISLSIYPNKLDGIGWELRMTLNL